MNFRSAILAAAVVVCGCGGGGPGGNDLAAQLQGLDAAEALLLANEWRTTQPEVVATLTADAVEFVLPTGERVSIPFPPDEKVLAVAPYVMSTHPCQFHSVTGCTGEMAGIPMYVHAETPDGTVIVDGMMTTMDNGFLEIWLPRDMEIDLTITAGGAAATQRVTTYATSETCITGMRLE